MCSKYPFEWNSFSFSFAFFFRWPFEAREEYHQGRQRTSQFPPFLSQRAHFYVNKRSFIALQPQWRGNSSDGISVMFDDKSKYPFPLPILRASSDGYRSSMIFSLSHRQSRMIRSERLPFEK